MEIQYTDELCGREVLISLRILTSDGKVSHLPTTVFEDIYAEVAVVSSCKTN